MNKLSKTSYPILTLLIVLFLSQSCSSGLRVDSSIKEYRQTEDECKIEKRVDVRLQLNLLNDRRVFSPDEKILCELVLTNLSDSPILINSRFRTGYADGSHFDRDVYFCITKDGQRYKGKGIRVAAEMSWELTKKLMVKREHFLELQPGEKYSKDVPIFFEYPTRPSETGTYQAFAVYENYYKFFMLKKKDILIGSVASNTVEFVIE